MYHFIVNLKASSGKGREIWTIIEQELEKRHVEHVVYITKHRGHARQLTTMLTSGLSASNQEITIVAIGGDGTINEVVNGMVDFTHTTVGYIPAGSGNDLARGLKMFTDPILALDAILLKRQVLPMDIGVLRRAGKETRFAVSAGVGFDAAVCHQVAVSRLKKILNMIYL